MSKNTAEEIAIADLIPKEALDRLKVDFGNPPVKVIAKVIFTLGKLHERGEIDYDLSKPIKLIEEHTTQTLDRLKGKVDDKEMSEMTECTEDYNRGYMNGASTMKCVILQLIEEVRDE